MTDILILNDENELINSSKKFKTVTIKVMLIYILGK